MGKPPVTRRGAKDMDIGLGGALGGLGLGAGTNTTVRRVLTRSPARQRSNESGGGGWLYQSEQLVTTTGSTISAASFGDVDPPPTGVTGIGVLSVRFRDPVVDTPAWATEVDDVFDAFRLYGFMPYGWGRVVAIGADASRGGDAFVSDSGGNASPIVFPVTGDSWPASYTTSITNGTSDIVATYDLWTPST